ncbi:hypothetical protein BDR04DRAFT_872358 [Suillus decipiens]|nr:hypothetical protein BDR04DRAFT_872358 [Suillus decipiens]
MCGGSKADILKFIPAVVGGYITVHIHISMLHAWMVILIMLRSEILVLIFMPVTKCSCTSSCEIRLVYSVSPSVHTLVNNPFGSNTYTDEVRDI